MMATQTMQVQVPIELPSAERLEALYLQAAREAIAERDTWLKLDEAADYLRMARRTFDRKRKKWGLPVSDLDGSPIVLRADLDEIARRRMHIPGGGRSVIAFPSQEKTDAPAQHAGAA